MARVLAFALFLAGARAAAVPRRAVLGGAGTLFARGASVAGAATSVRLAVAAEVPSAKREGLSPSEISAIVAQDMATNQFLVTGKLTRAIYDESATFKDEIDTCASASAPLYQAAPNAHAGKRKQLLQRRRLGKVAVLCTRW